jgi:biotin carboxyl carrier protein
MIDCRMVTNPALRGVERREETAGFHSNYRFNQMTDSIRKQQRIRKALSVAVLISLLAVILVQRNRIQTMELAKDQRVEHEVSENSRKASVSARFINESPADRRDQRTHQSSAGADAPQADDAEKQLAEIAAPLTSEMASTMFNADVKAGQSVVTGGYQTVDGRNQFTILKPRIISDRNGGKQIEIDSNLIAMSLEDTKQSGLDSLATNARNTLQHAEAWEESDVASTMEILRDSSGSQHLGQPKCIVAPGEKFTIQMTSDDQSSYSLTGTAELSGDGAGVVLKARIEQKEAAE